MYRIKPYGSPLYGGNTLNTRLPDGSEVALVQRTGYPWDGDIRDYRRKSSGRFILHYAAHSRLVAGCIAADQRQGKWQACPGPEGISGSVNIWQSGDVIELALPMPARLMAANPLVEETRGQVAVQRGPVVYCLESAGLPHGTELTEIVLPLDIELTPAMKTIADQNILCLAGNALVFRYKRMERIIPAPSDAKMADDPGQPGAPISPGAIAARVICPYGCR